MDFGSVDSGRKAFTYLMDFERLRLEQIERKGQKYFSESLGFVMQSKLYMRDWPWKVGIHLNLKEAIQGIYKLKEFEMLAKDVCQFSSEKVKVKVTLLNG